MSTQHVSVCTFVKTSPCMPAPRAHVETCVRKGYTRGRVEWTYDFSGCHTHHTTHHTAHTPHHNNTTQHNTTQHNTTNTTQHNTPQQHDHNTSRKQRQMETETQRQTETDSERRWRQKEKRREKREERREKRDSVWWCMAVLCSCSALSCSSVNARFLSLHNSVKHDSSLISFSAPWHVNSFQHLRKISSMQLQFFFKKKIFRLRSYIFEFLEIFSYAATFFLPELILHKYLVEGHVPLYRLLFTLLHPSL